MESIHEDAGLSDNVIGRVGIGRFSAACNGESHNDRGEESGGGEKIPQGRSSASLAM